jgi:predicted transcriptional regulator
MTETVVFSLRLDPEQVERIDKLMERRHRLLYPLPAAATRSRMTKLNRADTVRWLLELGIAQATKDLDRREGWRASR